MSATVFTLDAFRRAVPSSTGPTQPASAFANFEEVCSFVIPDPVWVSPDLQACGYSDQDARLVREFFAWFGFSVDPGKCPESQGNGWEFLIGELASAAGWKRDSPATYRNQCRDWSAEQLAYLDALIAGNRAKVLQLVGATEIAFQLRKRMRTPEGSALSPSQ